jgi:hypothetical protein
MGGHFFDETLGDGFTISGLSDGEEQTENNPLLREEVSTDKGSAPKVD